MRKILLTSLSKDDGGAMVSIDPFFRLEEVEVKFSFNPTYDEIFETDVLYIHRAHTEEHLKAVLSAKRLGKKIWIEIDDDILNVPTDHFVHFIFNHATVKENILRMWELADVLTFTSTHMMDRYAKNYSYVVHLPPAFDENVLLTRKEPQEKRNKIISWRGSPTHTRSLMEFSDAIVRVERRHPGWKWEFIGQNPWFITDQFKDSEVQITTWMEPMQYFEKMQKMQPAVHFSVLTDNPFTRSRSNLAYIDATLGGALLLAPDWPHFLLPGVFRYPQKDQDEFVEIFDQVLTRFEEGKNYNQTVQMAWEHILSEMTFKQANEKRMEILDTLFQKKKGNKLCSVSQL